MSGRSDGERMGFGWRQHALLRPSTTDSTPVVVIFRTADMQSNQLFADGAWWPQRPGQRRPKEGNHDSFVMANRWHIVTWFVPFAERMPAHPGSAWKLPSPQPPTCAAYGQWDLALIPSYARWRKTSPQNSPAMSPAGDGHQRMAGGQSRQPARPSARRAPPHRCGKLRHGDIPRRNVDPGSTSWSAIRTSR